MGIEGIHRKTCQRWNLPWDAHELTFSCYQRRAFLSKDRTRQYLADAINQARDRLRFHVWAYAMMPEHVHLIIWPAKEDYSISKILQAVKQPVSRRAIGWLKTTNSPGLRLLATGRYDRPHQFWQDGGGYDRNIRNGKALTDIFNYIHNNPVNRGLASRPEDWLWSSAPDWAGLADGPILIDKQTCLNSMG
ncbi:MAG: transposase [Planctomycetaceae bacterium]|nr:MAG: transposase [Planctomycetaceae bacterium]